MQPRLALLVALLAMHCAPNAPAVATAPGTQLAALPAPTPAAPSPPRTWRKLVLPGEDRVRDAAWVGPHVVAATRTELWTLDPDDLDTLVIMPLAGPIGRFELLDVSPRGGLVGVALADGSVDLFRNGARVRTLAPRPGDTGDVRGLTFSPDERTLVVNRNTGPNWLGKAIVYDVESGRVRGAFPGGGARFDETSTYLVGHVGTYTLDGREIAKFPEGSYVRDNHERLVPSESVGGEFIAKDDVARGFAAGYAVHAAEKFIAFVDPKTGATQKVAASCAPGAKLSNFIDRENARMIGVCTDGAIVTDLKTRASTRSHFFVAKNLSTYTDLLRTGPTELLVWEIGVGAKFYDVLTGALLGTAPQDDELQARFKDSHCVHPSHNFDQELCPRVTRADGAYTLHVTGGLVVNARGKSEPLLDWTGPRTHPPTPRWRAGALEAVRAEKTREQIVYRFGPEASLPSFEPQAPCKNVDWYPKRRTDTFATYTAYLGSAPATCVCNAAGCTQSKSAPGEGEVLAVHEDGRLVNTQTDRYSESTAITLHDGKRQKRGKLPIGCGGGTFTESGRLALTCDEDERGSIIEIDPGTFRILHRRDAPSTEWFPTLDRAGDDLLFVGGGEAIVVDWAWLEGSGAPKDRYFLADTYAIRHAPSGAITFAGDRAKAAAQVRCHAGTTLKPFAACE